jgi:hypothetical protein
MLARPDNRRTPEINRMNINRHYSGILRGLRSIEMPAHERRHAQQEARRAVIIVELLTRAIGDRSFGGGHRVLKPVVDLRGASRA